MEQIEIDFYKDHASEWMFDTPFVDTIMCSHCLWQFPEKEFATPFCPNCGYMMNNYGEMIGEK